MNDPDDLSDLSDTIVANSKQLNASDLVGGSIIVQITGGKRIGPAKGDQPLQLQITGGHMPWRPCKGMRGVMIQAWGKSGHGWIGKWVELYREPTVKWGGDEVGGIQIRALSDVPHDFTVPLTVSRGRKVPFKVRKLAAPKQSGAPTADMDALLGDEELTVADVNRWREKNNKPTLDTLNADKTAQLAGWLAANPKRLDEIRALIPQETA